LAEVALALGAAEAAAAHLGLELPELRAHGGWDGGVAVAVDVDAAGLDHVVRAQDRVVPVDEDQSARREGARAALRAPETSVGARERERERESEEGKGVKPILGALTVLPRVNPPPGESTGVMAGDSSFVRLPTGMSG
jgi:hypothetical protein